MKRLRRRPALLGSLFVLACAVGYTAYSMNQQLAVDPATCKPLLDVIAHAESKGNYNAYFGNAGNSTTKFTEMSVGAVMGWQAAFIADGKPSSAVGRYQIISTTLSGLVQDLNIDTEQLFDESMQDRMAMALLERRGVKAYANRHIDARAFAAELAKEWAGLPKVLGDNPEQSYYAGDGLNSALIASGEVLRAIGKIETVQ